jgi:prepilin-type N-terminal cleavage/methylation domain-containing protein
MNKLTIRSQVGVTLIELLVVMGLFGIVMGALYCVYSAHHRSAYTQDEVVEVQQNLKIGIESITRDIRMAGILVPDSPNTGEKMPPVQLAGNATGILQPLPAPDNIYSDEMTLNTASASATFARIAPLNNAATYFVTAATFILPVDSSQTVDSFNVNDHVRIVRPRDRFEPKLSNEALLTGRVYRITGTNREVPSLTLNIAAGYSDPANIILNKGDMICKTASPYTNPNTIKYCLGPTAACGPGATCPSGQHCLMRNVNNATTDVIAQNVAGLQFRYLLDDGTEVDTPMPDDYRIIRAVRVTLTGRTFTTNALSGAQAKMLQTELVVQIRNR